MSTPVRLPQGWGHVTLAEFGALDTLRRGAAAVIAAAVNVARILKTGAA